MKTVILGGGLAGLSTAYHLGHENCVIYEKNSYVGGHIHSEVIDGYTWDEGPHVSFTKHELVRALFAESVEQEYLEYAVKTANYYKGNWIPHPAQSNLYAVPQPLREECLDDFLKTRGKQHTGEEPANFEEWLIFAFGETFASNFPLIYTKKYWTADSRDLSTDWVGSRVFYPKVEQVKQGYLAPLEEETHYIKKIRYPKSGGYFSFAKLLAKGANVKLKHEISHIDLEKKIISFTNGNKEPYNKLVNTLPLPIFTKLCNAPEEILEAVSILACSAVLLVNVMANHPTKRKENWIYVYDEDKYSTRINCTELLSPNNAPEGKTGVQVEVYFSDYRPFDPRKKEEISKMVCEELIEMGLVESEAHIDSVYTKYVEWANVIFDNKRKAPQSKVLNWLEQYGLKREKDDLEPMTNWDEKLEQAEELGELILAGRFGQWKYFWTDDCVLRGKFIAENF